MIPLGFSGGSQDRLMVLAVAAIRWTVGTADGATKDRMEETKHAFSDFLGGCGGWGFKSWAIACSQKQCFEFCETSHHHYWWNLQNLNVDNSWTMIWAKGYTGTHYTLSHIISKLIQHRGIPPNWVFRLYLPFWVRSRSQSPFPLFFRLRPDLYIWLTLSYISTFVS